MIDVKQFRFVSEYDNKLGNAQFQRMTPSIAYGLWSVDWIGIGV